MKLTTLLAAQLINKEIEKSRINFDNALRDKYIEKAYSDFNIPRATVIDYISHRSNIEQASILDTYIMCYEFDSLCKTDLVSQIFTEVEIRSLKKEKYPTKEFKFPIKVRCIRVASDQWIGVCDADFLMKLRDARIINYNINAQRVMKHYIKNGEDEWKIATNKTAINEMKELYSEEKFIPNTITLNIPEGEENFRYDNDTATLTINSVKHLDISDGYHRYLAMALNRDSNPKFNYPMELRITHFPDIRVQQFIHQEDHKTKMKKIDSDAMDMYAPENLVTERINRDPMFCYFGNISHGNSVIDFSEFAACVKYFYFGSKHLSATEKATKINAVKNELIDKLNQIMPIEGMERYDLRDLMIIFTGIDGEYGREVILDCLMKKSKFVFRNKEVRRGIVNEIKKEMNNYVQ